MQCNDTVVFFTNLGGVVPGYTGPQLCPPVQQQPRHAVVAEPRGLVQRRPAGLVSLVNAGPGLQQQLHDVWDIVRDLSALVIQLLKEN